MIEIEIPKDIRKYDAKLIGPLNGRQTACLVTASVLGYSIYKVLEFLPQDVRFLIIVVVAAPILLCGWYKPYGMPLEKFIRAAFTSNVLSPSVRKYITINAYSTRTPAKDKQAEDLRKKKAKKRKNSKEFISYE